MDPVGCSQYSKWLLGLEILRLWLPEAQRGQINGRATKAFILHFAGFSSSGILVYGGRFEFRQVETHSSARRVALVQ